MNDKITFLSYNIHGGKSSFFRKEVIHKIENLIIESHADVLCLQELWRDLKTQKKQLEETLSNIWPFFEYGENAFFPGHNLGNAVLSRFDLTLEKNYSIGGFSKEKRGLLHTKLLISPYTELDIFCTHLSTLYRERLSELIECIDIIKTVAPARFIFAGDFNDWNKKISKVLIENLGCNEVGLESIGKYFRTFPTILPILCLDRIYYKGINLVDAKTCSQRLGPSDHRYILAHFEIEDFIK